MIQEIVFDVVIHAHQLLILLDMNYSICVSNAGVDNLFLTQMLPILPSTLVNIVFIPVRYENRREIEPDHSLYVIRIIVPAKMNTLYYLKNRNICFVRRPEGNVKLDLKEVRELAVLFCEKRFVQSASTL